jgi:hypothetical protein
MNELDREEQELLATFEAGEWQSVKEPNRLLELQGYAKAAIAKDKRVTLRLSSADSAEQSLILPTIILAAIEAPPTITVAPTDPTAAETNAGQIANPGQFTLSRTGNTPTALAVNYTLTGTATKGTKDFTVIELSERHLYPRFIAI